MPNQPNLAVILGYYDSLQFLNEQLQSIFAQDFQNFEVFIFDDGSPHALAIDDLILNPEQQSKTHIIRRDVNQGFAINFMKGLSFTGPGFDYYAFSDQDDLWLSDKLTRAIKALENFPDLEPVLYCGRSIITNHDGCVDNGLSPLFERPPSFANALVQSIAGGNTMLFNNKARSVILSTDYDLVVSHDWWAYLAVTAVGGRVIYDPEPCLKYRQHNANLVGSNKGWESIMVRVIKLLTGKFRDQIEGNFNALNAMTIPLTSESRKTLNEFRRLRKAHWVRRIFQAFSTKVHRQTMLGQFGLIIGLMLKRF